MAQDTRPRFLLLVPSPPSEGSLASYKTLFGETIAEVLKEVASHSEPDSGTAILEIALACPQLVEHLNAPRASLYPQTQRQIALLYKLVVVIASRDNIDLEDEAGVDVRIIPVAWSAASKATVEDGPGYGPVVSLGALARSTRPWQYAFGVESDEGEQLVKAFVAAKSDAVTVAEPRFAPIDLTGQQRSPSKHYDVAVGGTFDHMHIGHKLLLTMTLFAVDTAEGGGPASVTIGITGDELLKNKKYAEAMQSWEKRQQSIEDFCDTLLDFTSWPAQKAINRRDEAKTNGVSVDLIYGNGLDVKCTMIQDPFGPTITEQAISALIISAETRSGGKAVNDKRKDRGWSELEVFEVDVLDAAEDSVDTQDFEAKLSSTAIRQKLVSRKG